MLELLNSINVNTVLDLVAAWGMGAVLWHMKREPNLSPLTGRTRVLFQVLFLFFCTRSLVWQFGYVWLDIIAYLPAVALPVAEILYAESLLKRRLPGWLRLPVFAGSLVFGILNVAGLRLHNPPVEAAFSYFVIGVLAICAASLLMRDRRSLTLPENRFIDAMFLAVGVVIPLAATDFSALKLSQLRLGGLAALLLAYTMTRAMGRLDALRVLAIEYLSRLLEVAVVTAVLVIVLGMQDPHQIARVAAVSASFLILLMLLGQQRILQLRQREDSFLNWVQRLQTDSLEEFLQALREFPLTRDHRMVRLGDLEGYDLDLLRKNFKDGAGLLRLEELAAANTAESAELLRLMSEHGMSQALRVYAGEERLLLFKGPVLAGGRYEQQKLAVVQKMAAAMENRESMARKDEALRQGQKMEALGRLAGGVAHDFGNLLAVVSGYAGTLKKSLAAGSQQEEDAGEILKAAQRGRDLTGQLMAFGGRQRLDRQPLDLAEVVRKADGLLRPLIKDPVRLKIETPSEPVMVLADRGQMEQVLLNLVMNARDAMPEGGELKVEVFRPENEEAVLAVSDQGTGMDEEVRKHIFEPFYSTKAAGKGTGLGLPTVYGIVEQSGGRLNVQSTPGKGSRFEARLPLLRETPVEERHGG